LGSAKREDHVRRLASTERFTDSIAATRFGPPRTVYAPGRIDLARSTDEVVSTTCRCPSPQPHLFGSHLDAFVDDAREVLLAAALDGRFWDWPGGTEIVLATKPSG
jgi:hypothetical protein